MVITMTMPITDSSKDRERNGAGMGGFYYQLAAQIRERWDYFIKSLCNMYSCINGSESRTVKSLMETSIICAGCFIARVASQANSHPTSISSESWPDYS